MTHCNTKKKCFMRGSAFHAVVSSVPLCRKFRKQKETFLSNKLVFSGCLVCSLPFLVWLDLSSRRRRNDPANHSLPWKQKKWSQTDYWRSRSVMCKAFLLFGHAVLWKQSTQLDFLSLRESLSESDKHSQWNIFYSLIQMERLHLV